MQIDNFQLTEFNEAANKQTNFPLKFAYELNPIIFYSNFKVD